MIFHSRHIPHLLHYYTDIKRDWALKMAKQNKGLASKSRNDC